MSRAFVADTSIAVGWVHPSQATDLTRKLIEEINAGTVFHVTSLWPLEVGNALLCAVRRKIMTDAQRKAGLSLLSQLNAVVDLETASRAWTGISDLAVRHTLSIYDASYLELAIRKTLPLASRDEPLRTAAKKNGLIVL